VAVSIGVSQYLEATIPTGDSPTDVLWNPVSNKVYVANSQSDNVTIINGASNQVIATVDVQEYPSGFAWNSVMNKVYCVSGDNERVTVIDGAGDTVIKTFRTAARANGIAFNSTLNKLYIACNEDPVYRVTVIDAGPDTVMKYIGIHDVWALLWHPVTNRVFCTMGAYDSMISVIDCVTDEVVATPRIPGGVGSGCVNPRNDLVYLAGYHWVWVLSPAGDSLVTAVAAWGNVCFVPFPNKLYVLGGGWAQVVDCATNTVVDSIHTAGANLLCDTVRGKVYATDQNRDDVFILDARADTLIKTIPLGRYPSNLCWNQTNSRVYIVDLMDDVVYVIRDTASSIAEGGTGVSIAGATRTIAGRSLRYADPGGAMLVDVSGRSVVALRLGDNDLGHLPWGVYVVRDAAGRVRSKVVKVN
jgi:YVTN family beta-propeller protein